MNVHVLKKYVKAVAFFGRLVSRFCLTNQLGGLHNMDVDASRAPCPISSIHSEHLQLIQMRVESRCMRTMVAINGKAVSTWALLDAL